MARGEVGDAVVQRRAQASASASAVVSTACRRTTAVPSARSSNSGARVASVRRAGTGSPGPTMKPWSSRTDCISPRSVHTTSSASCAPLASTRTASSAAWGSDKGSAKSLNQVFTASSSGGATDGANLADVEARVGAFEREGHAHRLRRRGHQRAHAQRLRVVGHVDRQALRRARMRRDGQRRPTAPTPRRRRRARRRPSAAAPAPARRRGWRPPARSRRGGAASGRASQLASAIGCAASRLSRERVGRLRRDVARWRHAACRASAPPRRRRAAARPATSDGGAASRWRTSERFSGSWRDPAAQ